MKGNRRKRPEIPCVRTCEGRNADCHSTCEKYKEFRRELDIFNYYDSIERTAKSHLDEQWVRGSLLASRRKK